MLTHQLLTSGILWRGCHEFFANFTLLMVAAHASGVLVSSLLKGKNLVEAMVSGRKLNRSSWEDVNPGKGKESQS